MDEIKHAQELSIMSTSGREMISKVIELVHVKLGNKAFMELCECGIGAEGADFFWKYIKYSWDLKGDPVAQLNNVYHMLNRLPNHPDIQVFMS